MKHLSFKASCTAIFLLICLSDTVCRSLRSLSSLWDNCCLVIGIPMGSRELTMDSAALKGLGGLSSPQAARPGCTVF